ncbi:unnamed protein product [Somion occarium]|uniref:Mitochondrial outer membrane transport complex Sam37/metaxin N-terminal domain-containing protein n=1 Tax=Somion occarium TaxID=3059160 RepID=A0ABP1D9R3_9APHY
MSLQVVGQLPYLTHGLHTESGLLAIQKFVEKLDGVVSPDAGLSGVERAQNIARVAHVESELGDLVAHCLFCLRANWYGYTRKTLVSELPVPQRYYLPDRLRLSYKPRLLAAELWDVPEIEEEDVKAPTGFQRLTGKRRRDKNSKGKFKSIYAREKVLERAQAILDVYSKLLGTKRFFHPDSERPSSLDIIFASHIQLLQLPLSDPLFQTLLTERYPTLITHANLVHSTAFPTPESFPPLAERVTSTSILSLFPVSRIFQKKTAHPPTPEERKFALMRWGFFGAAVGAFGLYMHAIGLFAVVANTYNSLRVVKSVDSEHEDEEEDEDEIVEHELEEEVDEDDSVGREE